MIDEQIEMKKADDRPDRAGWNSRRIYFSVVGILLLAFLVTALFYSFSVPIFEAQDESGHFFYIKYFADHLKLPDYRDSSDLEAAGYQSHQLPLYYFVHGLILKMMADTDLEFEFYPNPLRSQGLPALYFHNAPGEKFPFAGPYRIVHLLRLLNIFTGALTLLVIYQILRRMFPPDNPWPIAGTAFVGFLPQYTYLSATVNNDIAAVLFTSLSLLFLTRFLLSDGAPLRQVLLMGVFVSLALLSKQLALFLVPVAYVAVSLKGDLRQKILNWSALSAALALLAGWYYFRNYLLFGDPLLRHVQESELFPILVQRKTLPQFLTYFCNYFFQHFIRSFFGSFGYMTVWMSWNLYLFYSLAAGVGLAVFAAGLLDAEFRRRFSRKMKMPLVVFTLAIIVLMTQILAVNLVYSQPQGRWAFGALGILAVFWALGMERLTASSHQWKAVVAVSVVFFLVNLHVLQHTVRKAFPAMPAVVDVIQNQYQSHVGELRMGMVVAQTFRSAISGLDRVAVRFTTFGQYVNSHIVFHLRDAEKPDQDIAMIQIPAAHVKNETFHIFTFNPQPDSKGRAYIFYIESPNAQKGDAISLYYTEFDSYPGGRAFFNGKPLRGDLTFVTGGSS